MKSWKVIIEYENQLMEVYTEALYYSDAWVNIEKKYPGCIVKSLVEVQPAKD